jgi:hypothetical protein
MQRAGGLHVEGVIDLRAGKVGVERAEAGLRATVVTRAKLRRQRAIEPTTQFRMALALATLCGPMTSDWAL